MTKYLETSYDPHRDVLLARAPDATDTASEPLNGSLFIIRGLPDGQIVGVECLDFSRRGADEAWLAELPVETIFTDPEGSGADVSLAQALRSLWSEARERRLFMQVEERLSPLRLELPPP